MSEITYHAEITQRTPEWFALRKGRIGGSEAVGLTTPARMKTLIYKKAAEIISGEEQEEEGGGGWISHAAQRGVDLEPDALYEYFLSTEIIYDSVGYITNSDYEFAGLSPDGISKSRKIAQEVKCFASHKHIEAIDTDSVPTEVMPQISWYFFIMPDLEGLDFIMYDPRVSTVPLFIKRVLREDCIDFAPLYSIFVTKLKQLLIKLNYGN
jgi:hypothetical protein